LTNLEKIIFYEAGMTAQGDAVLPHEDHSRRAWYVDASQIKAKFKCTIEEAETLKMAFKILDTTPKMAKEFSKWLSAEGKFAAGYKWFQDIAGQLILVTDEGEPSIIDTAAALIEDQDEQIVDADNPAQIEMIHADGWHKLDDARDDAPRWEDRQPKIFKAILAQIRGAKTLSAVKAVGKSLFNDKRFTKTQTTVIWDEYNRRKHALEPKLRALALKALERMIAPDCQMGKVANWLHGDGKKLLNVHEQSVVWAAWKKVKASKAPRQVEFVPEPTFFSTDFYYEDYNEYLN
jgi:hypothetical protein